MKIGIVQMNVVLGDRAANRATVVDGIGRAMADAPDVIVLPELWDLGFYPSNVRELGDPDGREARELLGGLAVRHGVNIVGGSIVRRLGDALYNTCLVFDRAGKELAAYDKTHLFSPSGEQRHFQAGETTALFSLDGILCGVLICYDLRFGELARTLVLEGAELLFVPAAWPHPRLGHWQLLCRTRALENQCFLAAANACGSTGKLRLCGYSQVVDPWGEVLAEAEEKPGSLTAECDFSVLRDVRARMNIFADRRPGLYRCGQSEAMNSNSLYSLPEASSFPDGGEFFEVLFRGGDGLFVERIVSHGHTTPEGQWYDQEKDEWVAVLQGEARLLFADGREARLGPGMHLFLPRHEKHRVTYTSSPCIWLAIHGSLQSLIPRS